MSGNETPDRSAAHDRRNDRVSIQKLELPTPQRHREVLHFPRLEEIDSLWHSNLDRQNLAGSLRIGEQNLADLKRVARAELVRLAWNYSRQYGDFREPVFSQSNHDPIVLAGHQPELFHPGVWYKNFLLSRFGQRFNGTAINLVVDNDICSSHSIRVPQLIEKRIGAGQFHPMASSRLVPFDGPGRNIPYEERGIEDRDIFESFESRAAQSISQFVSQPIVHELWCHVRSALNSSWTNGGPRLGPVIAAGRHRLERENGLQTLEIGLSDIANTTSFANFVWHIISDLHRFREIYNDSLAAYREVYRLRSRSHPVPELDQRDAWIEIPFWIWHHDKPQRKRAYVCLRGNSFLISDMDGWQLEIQNRFAVNELSELASRGTKIRPRALMTTMYCRLVLSDLFVHGIGGGKYDQLTDLIAERFLGQPLPEFCVASATMKLATGTTDDSPADITAVKQRLRELDYQPERFISRNSSETVGEIIDRKNQAIHRPVRRDSYEAMSERHQDIVNANRELQPFVKTKRDELEARMVELTNVVPANRILGSREFSFCLFPSGLIDELKALVD